MEGPLFTSKVTLVPDSFLDPASARDMLAKVASVQEGDAVKTAPVPGLGATLVYAVSPGETPGDVLPELYYLLLEMDRIGEYNKIVASWGGGYLHLVIAQGKTLCLANVFEAPDFTTAQYFLLLCMRRLQLNPEVSTAHFRSPLDPESEMSLYRYFKGVVQL